MYAAPWFHHPSSPIRVGVQRRRRVLNDTLKDTKTAKRGVPFPRCSPVRRSHIPRRAPRHMTDTTTRRGDEEVVATVLVVRPEIHSPLPRVVGAMGAVGGWLLRVEGREYVCVVWKRETNAREDRATCAGLRRYEGTVERPSPPVSQPDNSTSIERTALLSAIIATPRHRDTATPQLRYAAMLRRRV